MTLWTLSASNLIIQDAVSSSKWNTNISLQPVLGSNHDHPRPGFIKMIPAENLQSSKHCMIQKTSSAKSNEELREVSPVLTEKASDS